MTREELKLEPGYTMCDVCLHDMICKAEQRGEPYRDVDMCIMFEPQRLRGKWIVIVPNVSSKCPFCSTIVSDTPNFCQNCGASMSANDKQVTGKLDENTQKHYGFRKKY